MQKWKSNLLWMTAFALAMGLLEAAVVVYLRGLLNISNENVRLLHYEQIEVLREAATVVMLAAVGWLAGTSRTTRFYFFAFAFGLWDVAYYGWLKVFIDWPYSLFSPDVLFLIPVRWTGPVLAPVMIALLMCLGAVLALRREAQGIAPALSFGRVMTLAAGGVLALLVFMSDALLALAARQPDWNQLPPGEFRWGWFLISFAAMLISTLQMTLGSQRTAVPYSNYQESKSTQTL